VESDSHAEIVSQIIRTLREERLKQGISQEGLAMMTGLSRGGVRHVEGGKFHPTLHTLLRIAGALDVNLPTLIADAQRENQSSRRGR
jgi:transcriptional regulator with XRE-family HTH domain